MQRSQDYSYPFLLQKAWPIILANAAVPMLGLIDTAIIGNFGVIEDLGAIALGSLIFNFVYWSFGFLRMGTTGFVAQANGASNEAEVRAILGRALLLAVILGISLIALQWPISYFAFNMLSAGETVEATAQAYFSIRIWGAPATLSIFALLGLLVGLGLSRQLLQVQLFLNGLNIILDLIFAGVFQWGVEGIALGTVLSEWSTIVFAGWIIVRHLRRRSKPQETFWHWGQILDRIKLLTMVSANTDIMIRTLILVFSFAWFTNQSALYGNDVLAANYILLQLITFSAFFLDGYAFVAESLVGAALGAGDKKAFAIAVRRSTILALASASVLAAAVALGGNLAVALLTDLQPVRETASELLYLAVVYVFVSFAAFQLDGIFIGISFTRQMRNAAALSIMVYMVAWWMLAGTLGVVGLWWSFIIYVGARAVALLLYYPAINRRFEEISRQP